MALARRRPALRLKWRFMDAAFGLAAAVYPGRRISPADVLRPGGRILVILLEGLGDSLAFTPALRSLRHGHPDARIDLLVNDISYEVFRTTNHADGFILWRRRNGRLGGTLSLAKALRANRYSVALTPSLLFRHICLTSLSGAAVRAGFDVAGRGFALNVPLELDRRKSRILCYLDLVGALGAADCGGGMEIEISPDDESSAFDLLSRRARPGPGPLVIVHPGTRQAVNEWPAERYARLADILNVEMGATVLFTGARGDSGLVGRIGSMMRTRAVSLAGETSLRQLAALFRKCDLLVCPDTGAMHLGSAVGAPMLVLMGGRNFPEEWAPLSPAVSVLRHEVPCSPCHSSICVEGDVQCMRSITLEEVAEKACEYLSRRPRAELAARRGGGVVRGAEPGESRRGQEIAAGGPLRRARFCRRDRCGHILL